VKRFLILSIAVLACGSLATACDASPPAATVNGSTISTDTLYGQLQVYDQTVAGRCLLQLEDPNASPVLEGTGGPGTYDMAFTDSILDNEVGNQLAEQYATSKGLVVTPAVQSAATSEFESTLSGEISSQVEQAAESGVVSYCADSSGTAVTGPELINALPPAVRNSELHNQAVDQVLLADGADLSNQAMSAYYAANQSQFELDCVSRIVTSTQADATQDVAQITGGASFAAVAKADSIDTETAPDGGSLGCSIPLYTVEQSLGVTTAAVNTPLGPFEDTTNQVWDVYEITSQTTEPLSAARPVIRSELLEQSANVDRVSKELVAFAHRSNVSVDPQFGIWKASSVKAPASPPAKYLLGAFQPTSSLGG
jgi:hypothetical protein